MEMESLEVTNLEGCIFFTYFTYIVDWDFVVIVICGREYFTLLVYCVLLHCSVVYLFMRIRQICVIEKIQHITFRTGYIETQLEGSTIVSTLKQSTRYLMFWTESKKKDMKCCVLT